MTYHDKLPDGTPPQWGNNDKPAYMRINWSNAFIGGSIALDKLNNQKIDYVMNEAKKNGVTITIDRGDDKTTLFVDAITTAPTDKLEEVLRAIMSKGKDGITLSNMLKSRPFSKHPRSTLVMILNKLAEEGHITASVYSKGKGRPTTLYTAI